MAIEFNCSKCGAVLRAPDGTEGKEARCKSCGTIVLITRGSAPAASTPPVPPAEEPPEWPAAQRNNPFGTRAEGEDPFPQFGASPTYDPNPFASPRSLGGEAPFAPRPPSSTERDGPPWERDGAGIVTFFQTFAEAFNTERPLFDRMRREGGLGAPWMYAMVAQLPFVVLILGLALLFALLSFNDEEILGAAAAMVCCVVALPVMQTFTLFTISAVHHLLLSMLGAARHGFEATFRVAAYSTVLALPFAFVPCVGGIATVVAWSFFNIYGLASMQETTKGKAAVAVLIPTVTCCGLYLVTVIGVSILGEMR